MSAHSFLALSGSEHSCIAFPAAKNIRRTLNLSDVSENQAAATWGERYDLSDASDILDPHADILDPHADMGAEATGRTRTSSESDSKSSSQSESGSESLRVTGCQNARCIH